MPQFMDLKAKIIMAKTNGLKLRLCLTQEEPRSIELSHLGIYPAFNSPSRNGYHCPQWSYALDDPDSQRTGRGCLG